MSKNLIAFCIVFISFVQLKAQCTATTVPTGFMAYCGAAPYLTANTGTAYQWMNYSSPIAGATNQVYQPPFGSSTGYAVIVYNGTCSATSAVINIGWVGIPVDAITPADTTLAQGDSVKLCAHMNNPNFTSLTYQWYKDTTAIPGATYACYYAKTTGSYRLAARADTASHCSTSSSAIVRVPASVGTDENKLISATIIPNPADNIARLRLILSRDMQIIVSIADLTGRMLYKQEVFVQSGTQHISLPVENLTPGLYQVVWATRQGDMTQVLKFIKE